MAELIEAPTGRFKLTPQQKEAFAALLEFRAEQLEATASAHREAATTLRSGARVTVRSPIAFGEAMKWAAWGSNDARHLKWVLDWLDIAPLAAAAEEAANE